MEPSPLLKLQDHHRDEGRNLEEGVGDGVDHWVQVWDDSSGVATYVPLRSCRLELEP